MKKLFVMVVALAMTLSLAACGSSSSGTTTAAPADTTAAPAEASAAGTYTYQEDKGNFTVDWELTLNEDGTYLLSEHNGLVDVDTEHTGASYEQDGDTVKLSAWDDPDADKSDFFMDDGSSTWKLSGDTMEPVIDESMKSIAGTYNYVEPRGDFEITWKIVLNKGGDFVLEETHGLSGNVTSHTGKEWTDNGDGTFTTGAWDEDDNKSEFFRPNGEADWRIVDEATMEVEPIGGESADSEGSENAINPGKYIYVDGDTTWEILLMGNGNCRVDMYETATYDQDGVEAVKSHETQDGWTDNGDGTFETGEWGPEERDDPHPSDQFTSPNGVTTWKLTGEEGDPIPVEPTEKVETNTLQYGAYYWTDEENDTLYAIMIMGNGECRIQPRQKDDPEKVIGEQGNFIDYATKGFRDNGDGTFTTFAFDDSVTELPPFITGNGMCTWRIVDQENMQVELVEQLSE